MGRWQEDVAHYIVSLPERVVRSATALAGGLLQETGDAMLPASLRQTRLYRSIVGAALQFLVEKVGEVEGVYPDDTQLAGDFLQRRAVGNGVEFVGILTFRASPVWVLAALADVTGAGRHILSRIGAELRREGLIEGSDNPETVDQMLDALERAAGRTAETINTPPLEVAALRKEWEQIQTAAAAVPKPLIGAIERQWADLEAAAAREGRSVFMISAGLALSALTQLPQQATALPRALRISAGAAGDALYEPLMTHYSTTLEEIRKLGFGAWWAREFRPYLRAAARQFSPGKQTLTGRLTRGGPGRGV